MSEIRPDPEEVLRRVLELERRARRGHLKVFLGYASRVGKTARMLDEACRRHRRGQDVVVGWVARHPGDGLDALLSPLEVVPPRLLGPQGEPEMDVEAIVRRAPAVCIVDELAHSNAPGARHAARWEDVCELLEAGIKVITAVNVHFLDELQDELQALLGQRRPVTVPASLVAGADEVVLVDASRDDLGAGRPGQESETVLRHLREMALLYAADTVEHQVEDYRHEHHIEQVWPTCERILAWVTAEPSSTRVLWAAQRARHCHHGELFVVFVSPDARWSHLGFEQQEAVRATLALARSLEAQVEVLVGPAPQVLLGYARTHNITQLFVASPARPRLFKGVRTSWLDALIEQGAGLDLCVVGRQVEGEGSAVLPGSASFSLAGEALLGTLQTRGDKRAAPPSSSGLPPPRRGTLRIYLGYAAGVGKTYQMLVDGNRLKARGGDVVIGYFEPHERAETIAQLGKLELLPRRKVVYRGKTFEEMDVPAILARAPACCLVDELAHTNIPGLTHEKRWQDVEELLDHGIDVWTTVNIQHLESLNDFVRHITHVQIRETVPDGLLQDAADIVLVDVTTRALLHRLQRGVVYPKEKAEQALRNFFTEGNLSALRELAMRQAADSSLCTAWGNSEPASAAQGMLVCVGPHPRGAALVRRAKRVADRYHARCWVVHVVSGPKQPVAPAVEAHFALAASLEMNTEVVLGRDPAQCLVALARQRGVRDIFVGRPSRAGWPAFWRAGTVQGLLRLAGDLDIHVLADT